jgi:hypothetical protein
LCFHFFTFYTSKTFLNWIKFRNSHNIAISSSIRANGPLLNLLKGLPVNPF